MRLNGPVVLKRLPRSSSWPQMQFRNARSVSPPHFKPSPAQRRVAVQSVALRPDWTGHTQPLRHTWEGVINVDQFRWMVRRDMQEQLEMARRELGGRHVRAVGMFDD